MKKILGILLLGLSFGVTAGGVLDSEATDFEFDSESCTFSTNENCVAGGSMFQPVRQATIPLLFNPHLKRGSYQFDTSWYWRHRGLIYINPAYR